MDVLIRGLEGIFRRVEILLIRRIPPTKTLRAHLFGLTLAFAGAFFTIVLDHGALFKDMPWYMPLVAIFIFIFGTWLGGPFVILTAFFFTNHAIPSSPTFFQSFRIAATWYFIFYALGAVFTLLYDLFALLSLLTFGKKQIKIVFAYDTRRRINVIKAPDETQETAFYELISRSAELREQKLYDFGLRIPPPHPYTIAFVANPRIRRRQISGIVYERDPIITDLDLFLRTVHFALYSFEQDDIVGQYPIWSRVRVVTILDDTTTDAKGAPRSDDSLSLVQDFQDDVTMPVQMNGNLMIPRAEMVDNVGMMLTIHQNDLPFPLTINDIDVIFAVTASETQIRPTAYYSDFDERLNTDTQSPPQPSNGKQFIYNRDPNVADPILKKDPDIINAAPCGNPSSPPPPTYSACVHDEYTAFQGRVALNALSARRHTFIHEFAHAMSSAVRGAIGDEYYDKAVLLGKGGSVFMPFYVNRIERVQKTGGQIVPVHQVFAQYNDSNFLSDLNHPSMEAEWLSYFAEREQGITCTMDRDGFPFTFDKLIRRFIYDRLMVKLNR